MGGGDETHQVPGGRRVDLFAVGLCNIDRFDGDPFFFRHTGKPLRDIAGIAGAGEEIENHRTVIRK